MRSSLGYLGLRPWGIDRAMARSIRQGRVLRFPCNDQADEVNKLFTSSKEVSEVRSIPGGGRGFSRNLSIGCVARNMKSLGHSSGYSVGIWTSDCRLGTRNTFPIDIPYYIRQKKSETKFFLYQDPRLFTKSWFPYRQSRPLEKHTFDSSAYSSPFMSSSFGVLFNFCVLYWH